ncbi:MAG: ribbon-helix-helix protein, CopG family [Pseudomonadota bacterium]
MPSKTVGIRLDENLQKRLKSLGEKRDRSPHYLMKAAIEAYLQVEEAIEAEKSLMQSRWDRFELTGDTISQDDMQAWAWALGSGQD